MKAVDEWGGDEKELVAACTESVKSVISLLFCQRKKKLRTGTIELQQTGWGGQGGVER